MAIPISALPLAGALDGSEPVPIVHGGSPGVTAQTTTQAIADLAGIAGYQPLDSDLTAIAALTTTSFGRALLELANSAAGQTAFGVVIGTNVQAYDADLTTIAGLTATTDNFLVSVASAWASRTPAQAAVTLQGDGLSATSVGYRGMPITSVSAARTIAAVDGGCSLYHPPADTTARTWTIDSNANLALPVGFSFAVDNDYGAGVITVSITTDVLSLVGVAGSTGSRTIASGGNALFVKVSTTRWRCFPGQGVT